MRKMGLAMAALAAVMTLGSNCEAARWKIKSPKAGTTYAADANVSVSGKGVKNKEGVVGTAFVNEGDIFSNGLANVVAKKRRWAVVLDDAFSFFEDENFDDMGDYFGQFPMGEDLGENQGYVIVVSGDNKKGGVQNDFVPVNVDYSPVP